MSKKIRVVAMEKAEQFPINTRSEGYSFRYGANNITFNLGGVNDRLMDVNSLRLNFLLQVIDTDGGDSYVNNQDTYGTGARACVIDDRTGANGCIHTLRVTNGNSAVISEIRNYNRLLCGALPATKSFMDYKSNVSVEELALAKAESQGLLVNGDMPCSLKLRAGIFQDKPINLADMGDGLVIDITLAPDNLFLYGANAGDCYYRLKNVSLTWNWLVLSAPMPPSNEQFQYPLYRNFLNILQSSDSTTSLNFNLNSVRNVHATFIKSSSVNNSATNSFETNQIQNNAGDNQAIKEYSHRRNNVRYNNKFNVSERIATTNSVYPALLGRNGLNAMQPFDNIENCLQSPETQLVGSRTFKGRIVGEVDLPDARDLYILGVNYDQLSVGFGAEFERSPYGLRIESELTTSEANSIYTYALANAGLAVQKRGAMVQQLD